MKKSNQREQRLKNRPSPVLKSRLTSFRLFLLYLSPFVLYFSYYPRFLLASSASTNYELSLPLLWLALFALLSLRDFFRHLKALAQSPTKKPRLLFYLFPLYLSLSALWSPNPLRAVLTAGILWCLILSAVGILTNLRHQSRFRRTTLQKSFLLSAVLVSLFCWLQCCLDVWLQFPLKTFEVPRTLTLLCPGCTSRIFGFPHPSGFAIEPQFMGNLLLAPTLYSFYLFLTLKPSAPAKTRRRLALLSTFLLTTLFLVFSRGAIYSFFLGFLFLCFALRSKTPLPRFRLARASVLVLVSLVLCLSAQVVFAHDKTPRSAACTLSTSLAQLSLDVINFDCRTPAAKYRYELQQQGADISAASAAEANHPQDSSEPVYSGYVAVSTNTRLNLNRAAFESATASPTSFLFGYGLGSAGLTLSRQGKTASTMEIVQNEYFSLLLETGLLGLLLLLLSVVLLASLLKASPFSSDKLFFLSVLLAFAFSLNFFSGLPNALHLYLFPVLLLVSFRTQTGHKPKS